MIKKRRLLLLKNSTLLIAVVIAIIIFLRARRDMEDKVQHIRSFVKAANQPDYPELFRYLFEESHENLGFDVQGKQLRFYRTVHVAIHNAKITRVMTPKHLKMRDWLVTIDQKLFPWVKPRFLSTMDLKESYAGEGVVLYVCDSNIASAMAAISMVRVLSDIPIEVFHIRHDLSAEHIGLLEASGFVTVKDISSYFDINLIKVDSWSIKPLVLLACSFKKAMLIDANTLLLQPPETFLNNPLFLKTGALFFKDGNVTLDSIEKLNGATTIIKSLLPSPIPEGVLDLNILRNISSHQQDSGVIVVNKGRVFPGLMATAFLNVDKNRELLCKYFEGSKETFWIGFSTIKEQYSWAQSIPGRGGISELLPEGNYKFCKFHSLHVDINRNLLWINGALSATADPPHNSHEMKEFVIEEDLTSMKKDSWSVGNSDHNGCLQSRSKPFAITSSSHELLQNGSKIYSKIYYDKVAPTGDPVNGDSALTEGKLFDRIEHAAPIKDINPKFVPKAQPPSQALIIKKPLVKAVKLEPAHPKPKEKDKTLPIPDYMKLVPPP